MSSLEARIADIAQHLQATVSSSSALQTATSAVGALTVLYTTSKLFAFLYRNTFHSGDLKKYLSSGKGGSWALVTGGSDGIGHAFVEELLKRNFNVFIHGRNQEKLLRRKSEFESKYGPGRIEIIIADAGKLDATEPTAHVLATINHILSTDDGTLSLIINNVGGVQTFPQYLPLSQIPPSDMHNQISTNLLFPLHLTRTLLPHLTQACILNISSSTSILATPYIATYCGTKGFISAWSKALAVEMEAENLHANIEIKCAVIANTTSALNDRELGGITISAEECAKGCLDQVGGKGVFIYPHWKHALCIAGLSMMPDWVIRRIMIGEMRVRRKEEMEGLK